MKVNQGQNYNWDLYESLRKTCANNTVKIRRIEETHKRISEAKCMDCGQD